jgi:hypothetical protein
MEFRQRTLKDLANMICGNFGAEKSFFRYRSSSSLTEFFSDCDTEYVHDGSTRDHWVAGTLREILAKPQPAPNIPNETFSAVIQNLMDQGDALHEERERPGALAFLNTALARENFEAFYSGDKKCYLRHLPSQTVAGTSPNPHRPFSVEELQRRERIADYLLRIEREDELIEEVLLPLFRQMGFHRVTATGHKDKALEYGKDIWMKFTLPTQHVLYFDVQAKRDKIDASGGAHNKSVNVSEIYNQVSMMLGHEIFDPEIGKRVLVDHAFIVAGGTITKAARNWLGNKLDTNKRSQILFMDREDIINLFTVASLALPTRARQS